MVSVTESRRAKDGNLNRESEKKKIIENKTTTNENNFFYLKKALIKMWKRGFCFEFYGNAVEIIKNVFFTFFFIS